MKDREIDEAFFLGPMKENNMKDQNLDHDLKN
jgi:hypothetical protein